MFITANIDRSLKARTFSVTAKRRYLMTLLSLVLFAFSASQARAAEFTVSNLNDSGAGSLRAAIESANATAGADTIRMSVGGRIDLVTPLPAITDTVSFLAVNRIELNGQATKSLGAASIGLDVQAPNSVIRGFTVNRFGEAGIRVGVNGSGTTIVQNFVGTNAAGNSISCSTAADPAMSEPCGNLTRGIWVSGATNVLIGTSGSDGLPNIISGNSGRGISISSARNGNTLVNGSAIIRNNYIGTDITGNPDLGNTQEGILIASASGSIVGGDISTNQRNVIIGNDSHGIAIISDFEAPASNNFIRGNYIGFTLSSNVARQNQGSGIVIQAANNTIGGTSPANRNIISGNGANGVSIGGSLATGNIVSGNYIGVGADGSSPIPNRQDGVHISDLASRNVIGGSGGLTPGSCTGACNIIATNGDANAFTARAGIYVAGSGGTGNTFRGNSIFGNTGIGIDLGLNPAIGSTTQATGPTANDARDSDTGANNLQNSPTVSSADTNGTVSGTLNSTPNSIFRIDFYGNQATDGSDAEGRNYIGATTVFTDASGDGTFNFGSTARPSAGQLITATATAIGGSVQSIGDTSEFSSPTAVTAATTPAAQGFESDVAPRPDGNNGTIDSSDVNQIERFVIRLDRPFQSNEFQRADSAPINTRGDGLLNSADINQAERYLIGLDPRQAAGGPTAPAGFGAALPDLVGNTNDSMKFVEDVLAPRELRVESTNATAGQPVTVNIRVDAFGDESGYSFTLTYNDRVLRNPSVAIGTAGGTRQCDTTSTPGQITCSVRNFPNDNPNSSTNQIGEIAAGNNQLLAGITFTVASNAPSGATPLNFTAVSATNDISQPLTITGTNGTVTVAAPTAANASVSGRALISTGRGIRNAVITLSNQNGTTQTVLTNSFGYYRFADVPTGQTYTLSARSKAFVFAQSSQVINVNEETTDINFIAAPQSARAVK